jgi:hypothetical protein
MLNATKVEAAIVVVDIGQKQASTTRTASKLQVACLSSLLMLYKVDRLIGDTKVS